VWRPPTAEYAVPFVVAIVDVHEGFQMLGNVIRCEQGDLQVGLEVELEFHPIADGFLVPYFAPSQSVRSKQTGGS
jgi:uncharacterized OB-fold protein